MGVAFSATNRVRTTKEQQKEGVAALYPEFTALGSGRFILNPRKQATCGPRSMVIVKTLSRVGGQQGT